MDAHPSHEKLRLWLDERLGESEESAIAEHVSGCPLVCGSYLDQLSPFDQADDAGAPEVNAFELLPGAHIQGYEILSTIDQGGMGIVYRAWSHNLKRLVALKMLLGNTGRDPRRVARFQREIEAAASLRHPNIITVYDAGGRQDIPFLVMEFAERGTLEELLGDRPLEPTVAAVLTELLARGVQFAHAKGVFHRDLKPQNILLSAQEPTGGDSSDIPPWCIVIRGIVIVPKIADFGLVKFADDDHPHTGLGLTSVDDHLGTPSYMAPEQVRGDSAQIDARTDVYSLGAILYRLLAKRPPFSGTNRQEIFQQVLRDDPKPPRQLDAGIPRSLEAICLKCLAKDPDEASYADANGLANDLCSFLKGEPVRARHRSFSERIRRSAKKRPYLATIVGSLALTMTLLGMQAFFATRNLDSQRVRAALDQLQTKEEMQANEQALVREMNFRKLREAQVAMDDGNEPEALHLLAQVPKEGRGWAWRHMRKSSGGCLFSLVGHEETVTQVEFTPDGTKIVSCSKDKTVRIWDARTGLEQRVLRGHTERVLTVAVSPDNLLIASGGEDGTVRVWQVQTGREVLCLKGSGDIVTHVAFSPDGGQIVSSTRKNHAVYVWDVQNGHELIHFAGHKDDVNCAAFSPDGLAIASGDSNGWLIAWDLRTGRERQTFRLEGAPILRTGFSSDGVYLWASTRGGTFRRLDLRTEKQINEVSYLSADGKLCVSAMSPDGTFVVGDSHFGRVIVWDIQAKRETWKGNGHLFPGAGLQGVAISPDGSLLATASVDRSIRVWDARGDQRAGRLRIPISRGSREGIAFSPDGDRIVASSRTGNTQIWSAQTGLPVWELENQGKGSTGVAFSFDNRLVATCGDDRIDLWDGHKNLTLMPTSSSVRAVAFSPDSTVLASAHVDCVRLLNTASGEIKVLGEKQIELPNLAFCPDGRELVTVAKGGLVQFWDYRQVKETRRQELHSGEMEIGSVVYHPQGKRLAVSFASSLFLCDLPFVLAPMELKGHAGPVRSVAWLSGGELIASGSDDGSIRIWNAETGEMQQKLEHHHPVFAVAVNPIGDTIASCGEDSAVWLWTASTELPVVEMEAHQEAVNCIALTDDGERLASGGEDKTIRIWDTHTGDLLETQARRSSGDGGTLPERGARGLHESSRAARSRGPEGSDYATPQSHHQERGRPSFRSIHESNASGFPAAQRTGTCLPALDDAAGPLLACRAAGEIHQGGEPERCPIPSGRRGAGQGCRRARSRQFGTRLLALRCRRHSESQRAGQVSGER